MVEVVPVSPGTTLKLCLLAVLCGSFTTPFSATAIYQVYCPVGNAEVIG